MAPLTRFLRRRLERDRGSELIELAIVLPILLLVVAGIMDFGFLFQRYEVVTNAAREGARIGVLPGYLPADVKARAESYLANSGLTGTHPPPDVSYGTQTVGSFTINTVTVTVTYPSQFLFLGPFARLAGAGGASYGTINLKSVSTMRVEAAGGGS